MSNTPSIKQCNHLLFCIVYQSIFHLYKHFTYWYYSLIFTWILKIVVNVPVILILCFSNCCWNSCCNNDCWNSCYQQRLLEQGKTTKQMFVPTIIVETVVPTMIVGTAVPTKVVGTRINHETNFCSNNHCWNAKEMIVPTIIVGTAVPTIIVLTAYYWKSCHLTALVGSGVRMSKSRSVF